MSSSSWLLVNHFSKRFWLLYVNFLWNQIKINKIETSTFDHLNQVVIAQWLAWKNVIGNVLGSNPGKGDNILISDWRKFEYHYSVGLWTNWTSIIWDQQSPSVKSPLSNYKWRTTIIGALVAVVHHQTVTFIVSYRIAKCIREIVSSNGEV